MKKTLLSIASSFLLLGTSSAQSIKMGFQAGMTLSQAIGKDRLGNKERADIAIGGTAGFIFDFPVGKTISIQPGINYVQKGAKEVYFYEAYPTTDVKKVEAGARPQYLEIPVNFIYNTRTNKGNFFFGAGPTIAFAIAGNKDTINYMSSSNSLSTGSDKIKFGNTKDDDMRSVDIGANILAGFQSKSGFQLSMNYNIGLNNLMPKTTQYNTNEEGFARFVYVGFKAGWFLKSKR